MKVLDYRCPRVAERMTAFGMRDRSSGESIWAQSGHAASMLRPGYTCIREQVSCFAIPAGPKPAERSALTAACTNIPVSSYAAVLRGKAVAFRREYNFLLCALNPRLEISDKSTYISRMGHAQSWIDITRSHQPERLMSSETLFRENCTPRPGDGSSQ
jgi:hypothetical protein